MWGDMGRCGEIRGDTGSICQPEHLAAARPPQQQGKQPRPAPDIDRHLASLRPLARPLARRRARRRAGLQPARSSAQRRGVRLVN